MGLQGGKVMPNLATSYSTLATNNWIANGINYSTFCEVDLDSVIESQCEPIYSSNFNGGYSWSSVGVKIEESDTQDEQPLLGISETVNYVKVTLGLPNKDIASIFRVSRPTLDQYKKAIDGEHTVQAANRERVLLLGGIIKEIAPKFVKSPGSMAKNYMIDGKTLLDLLSEQQLDISRIVKLSVAIAEKMSKHSNNSNSINETTLNQLTKFA